MSGPIPSLTGPALEAVEHLVATGEVKLLGEILTEVLGIAEDAYEGHYRAGGHSSAEEYGKAVGQHEMAGDIVDALMEKYETDRNGL